MGIVSLASRIANGPPPEDQGLLYNMDLWLLAASCGYIALARCFVKGGPIEKKVTVILLAAISIASIGIALAFR